jgi:hypothetical protein
METHNEGMRNEMKNKLRETRERARGGEVAILFSSVHPYFCCYDIPMMRSS